MGLFTSKRNVWNAFMNCRCERLFSCLGLLAFLMHIKSGGLPKNLAQKYYIMVEIVVGTPNWAPISSVNNLETVMRRNSMICNLREKKRTHSSEHKRVIKEPLHGLFFLLEIHIYLE